VHQNNYKTFLLRGLRPMIMNAIVCFEFKSPLLDSSTTLVRRGEFLRLIAVPMWWSLCVSYRKDWDNADHYPPVLQNHQNRLMMQIAASLLADGCVQAKHHSCLHCLLPYCSRPSQSRHSAINYSRRDEKPVDRCPLCTLLVNDSN
jgi:hypothetical protein